MQKILGKHYILELENCLAENLNNSQFVKSTLLQSAAIANVTVLSSSFNRFEPQGISGIVSIAESHISIHTWPEYHYAAVDIFTCGDKLAAQNAIDFLILAFNSKNYTLNELNRGIYTCDKNSSSASSTSEEKDKNRTPAPYSV